jgi:microcystin-dependent protein
MYPPPGTVVPYIGGGITINGVNQGDPDGWVICDGQLRTATDNRFTNVYSILNTYMGVTSNTANSITPPNLTSRFIYGQTSAATTTTSIGGAASVALISNNIPSLAIAVSATDSGHTHLVEYYTGTTSIRTFSIRFGDGFPGQSVTTTSGKANITASGSYTPENKQDVATLPPYTTMNYIMKY